MPEITRFIPVPDPEEKSPFHPMAILFHYYPEDTPLRRLLLKHSFQVREKAFDILSSAPPALQAETDRALLSAGALLHDIGIMRCSAPGILCTGTEPYLAHGILGAQMLRQYGKQYGMDLEKYASICERHTGSGLTAQEIRLGNLPLPEQDFLPETTEEKLICLADKFFSKSGDMQEKSLSRIRRSMEKFGPGPLERFDGLCRTFGLPAPS